MQLEGTKTKKNLGKVFRGWDVQPGKFGTQNGLRAKRGGLERESEKVVPKGKPKRRGRGAANEINNNRGGKKGGMGKKLLKTRAVKSNKIAGERNNPHRSEKPGAGDY